MNEKIAGAIASDKIEVKQTTIDFDYLRKQNELYKHQQTHALLADREKTHGEFALTADISQKIKIIIGIYSRDRHSFPMLEALDSIAVKMARILSGDPNRSEHWKDIAGYAMLIARSLPDYEG